MVNDLVPMLKIPSSVIANFLAGYLEREWDSWEDGVDGATRIGSVTRREMILMIEDSKTDELKRNVIEELNEFPLDDYVSRYE